MSLYNMLHGVNPLAPVLLAVLDKHSSEFGRFRDIYLDEKAGKPAIAIYTRNGGGNREHYSDDPEGPECECTGCFMTYRAHNLPGYICDQDDDFDCTYATIWIEVPEAAREFVAALPKLIDGKTPPEQQQELIRKLQNGDKDDPDVKRAMAAMAPVLDQITRFLKGDKK